MPSWIWDRCVGGGGNPAVEEEEKDMTGKGRGREGMRRSGKGCAEALTCPSGGTDARFSHGAGHVLPLTITRGDVRFTTNDHRR